MIGIEEVLYMSILKMGFDEQVKYTRMKLSLSQEELAAMVGVSYSTVSRWEREGRAPQMKTLGRFYSFCEENGINFKEVEDKWLKE